MNDHSENEPRGIGALLLRLYWMFLGNIILLVSFVSLLHAHGRFGWADAIYWVSVPALVAARYVDIVKLKGLTATGEVANIKHWRKYALGMVLGGVLAWLAAHAIGRTLG